MQLDEEGNLIKPCSGSDLENSNAPSPPNKVQRSVSSTQKPRRPTDQGKPWMHRKWIFVCFIFFSWHSLVLSVVSYSKRSQGDSNHNAEDSGRKGSSGSSKVPSSPVVPGESKKGSTPSTVSVSVCASDTRLYLEIVLSLKPCLSWFYDANM